MAEQPVRARLDRNGYQVVDVAVHGGYHPGAIVARAHLPLRLVFRRDDDDVCSERVIFSAPRLDRLLAPTGATTIELPAHAAGEIRFTCGMGRYRGNIAFVEEIAILGRLRREAARQESAIGTALLLWICSLPLIALVAIVAFDARAALAAAGVALLAWSAGCLWAFNRRPERT